VDGKGGLVGTSQRTGLHLVCGAEFGTSYELTGTLEFVSTGKVADPAGGPILRYARDNDSHGLWLRKGSQRVVLRKLTEELETWPSAIGDSNEFRVQVWKGQAAAWANGAPVAEAFDVPGLNAGRTTRIGLGGHYNYGSETVVLRFSNLKIRKLTKPPVVPKATPDPKPQKSPPPRTVRDRPGDL